MYNLQCSISAGAGAGADDDDDEDDATGAGGAVGGKQNRNEKKARKALLKLGLKPVPSVAKVTVKKSKAVSARATCSFLSGYDAISAARNYTLFFFPPPTPGALCHQQA